MATDEFGVVEIQFTIKGLDLAGYVEDVVLTSESCADLQTHMPNAGSSRH